MRVEDLVKAAQKGDDEAFYMLIAENKDKLYSVAYCYLKSHEDVLEAIQEVTCRAYVKLNKLKEPKYFNTWLIRIAINYCIDEQKRRKKLIFMESDGVVEEHKNNLNKLIVEEAIEKLSPKCKEVIILKYFQDMTIADISKVVEAPEGTIKTWLKKGLEELRDQLNKGGEEGV